MEKTSTLGERVEAVIRALGITKLKFGQAVGLASGNVTTLCKGKHRASATTIKAICRTYNVNEHWLLTGEGEMFNARSDDEELAYLMGAVMGKEEAAFRREMVRIILELPDEAINMIEQFTRQRLDAYYEQQKTNNKNKED